MKLHLAEDRPAGWRHLSAGLAHTWSAKGDTSDLPCATGTRGLVFGFARAFWLSRLVSDVAVPLSTASLLKSSLRFGRSVDSSHGSVCLIASQEAKMSRNISSTLSERVPGASHASLNLVKNAMSRSSVRQRATRTCFEPTSISGYCNSLLLKAAPIHSRSRMRQTALIWELNLLKETPAASASASHMAHAGHMSFNSV